MRGSTLQPTTKVMTVPKQGQFVNIIYNVFYSVISDDDAGDYI